MTNNRLSNEYEVNDPNRGSRTVTAEEIIKSFEKSDLAESIGKVPLERVFGTWLMNDYRATVDSYAVLVADVHYYFNNKKELPITSNGLNKIKPYINFAQLCRSAGLNRSTIVSKISEGQALKYDESARLASSLEDVAQLIYHQIK